LLILRDVRFREFDKMGRISEADFMRLCFGGFERPAIAEHTPDHPERAYADRRGAVNQHRTIRWVVGDLQELGRLLFLWIAIYGRDIEVFKAELFGLRFLFRGAMLAGGAKVEDRFHAFRFQFLQGLELRLATGAKLFGHQREVENRRLLLLNL